LNPKRYKVLILAQSFVRRKQDIISAHLFVWARKILSLGYDVEVLAPHQEGLRFFERIEDIPIRRFRYSLDRYERLAYRGNMAQLVRENLLNKMIFLFFLFSFFWKALKLAGKEETKLIHAHWWIPSGLVGAWVSRVTGKPLLVTTHGTDIMILSSSRILRILAGFVFSRAACITVVSSFLKAKLLSILKIPSTKIAVLSMPVDLNSFSPSEKPALIEAYPQGEEAEKGKRILCVARYTKQKRLDSLINALALLKKEDLSFQAILIGEGEEEEDLKRMIENRALSHEVTLLPLMSQDKLSHYYRESDVVVLPSVDEGFGLVLVEAQLCQTPVVGADSGGIPEIIDPEKTGLLFPPGNAEALAGSIKRILTQRELARKLASKACQEARNKFSPENIAGAFVNIYDSLINKEDQV
jgi:glycosyltransferase involved in cell wall biosynthesis